MEVLGIEGEGREGMLRSVEVGRGACGRTLLERRRIRSIRASPVPSSSTTSTLLRLLGLGAQSVLPSLQRQRNPVYRLALDLPPSRARSSELKLARPFLPLSSSSFPPLLLSMNTTTSQPAPEDFNDDSSDLYSSSDERTFSPPPSSSSFVPHRRVDLNTELSEDNKGYRLLQKMGWKGSGEGLGVIGDGKLFLSSLELDSDFWSSRGCCKSSTKLTSFPCSIRSHPTRADGRFHSWPGDRKVLAGCESHRRGGRKGQKGDGE